MRQGTIRWFDGMSGEGMLRDLETGNTYYIHFTAIEGINKHNYHWPTDIDQKRLGTITGQSCEYELIEDPTFVAVSRCVLKGGAQ